MLERDVGDILDRASIAQLKKERIREEVCYREYEYFKPALEKIKEKYKDIPIDMFYKLLYKVNSLIWDKEADLRQGKLDGVLYEVGKRAIEIRDLNSLRVTIKNIVNKLTKTGFEDIKKDHLSQ